MIKIITDSAADIPAKELAEGQIEIMSIPITVDGVTYREGKDFTSEEYYQMLAKARSIPVHAQVTMLEYSEAFRKAIEEGYNNISASPSPPKVLVCMTPPAWPKRSFWRSSLYWRRK